MSSNSGSLAISELFGAAAFITTVVLGTIALIQPFSVDPRSFVSDVVWFIVAASTLIAFLADGQLVLGECLSMIGLYCAFAMFAVFRRTNLAAVEAPVPTSGGFRDHPEVDSSTEDSAGPTTSDNHRSGNEDTALSESNYPDTPPSLESDSNFVDEAQPGDRNDTVEVEVIDNVHELEALTLPPIANESTSGPASNISNVTQDDHAVWKHYPPLKACADQSSAERVLTVLCLPFLPFIGLTTPSRSTRKASNILVAAGIAQNANDSHACDRRSGRLNTWTSAIRTVLNSWRGRHSSRLVSVLAALLWPTTLHSCSHFSDGRRSKRLGLCNRIISITVSVTVSD